MEIDYTKYPAGVGLAEKIVLRPCPVCGESCHERVTKTAGARYVHRVRVYRHVSEKTKRAANKVEVLSQHRHTKSERLEWEAKQK